MAILYESPSNHVEKRSSLSAELRASMFELPREKWQGHPRLNGEAQFWLEIHEGFLSASATLANWTEQFLADTDMARMQEMARQISGLGGRLVHHAHGHHHIEDHHFFPMFLRVFPQLADPLELLDGDHKVLSQVLDDLEKSVAGFTVAPSGRERAQLDAWRAGAERLLAPAKRLDALFIRHIGDEEEICIPVMLQG